MSVTPLRPDTRTGTWLRSVELVPNSPKSFEPQAQTVPSDFHAYSDRLKPRQRSGRHRYGDIAQQGGRIVPQLTELAVFPRPNRPVWHQRKAGSGASRDGRYARKPGIRTGTWFRRSREGWPTVRFGCHSSFPGAGGRRYGGIDGRVFSLTERFSK